MCVCGNRKEISQTLHQFQGKSDKQNTNVDISTTSIGLKYSNTSIHLEITPKRNHWSTLYNPRLSFWLFAILVKRAVLKVYSLSKKTPKENTAYVSALEVYNGVQRQKSFSDAGISENSSPASISSQTHPYCLPEAELIIIVSSIPTETKLSSVIAMSCTWSRKRDVL